MNLCWFNWKCKDLDYFLLYLKYSLEINVLYQLVLSLGRKHIYIHWPWRWNQIPRLQWSQPLPLRWRRLWRRRGLPDGVQVWRQQLRQLRCGPGGVLLCNSLQHHHQSRSEHSEGPGTVVQLGGLAVVTARLGESEGEGAVVGGGLSGLWRHTGGEV